MPENTSKAAALEVLKNLRKTFVQDSSDPIVKELLTESLLEEVLEAAWQHQFDEDPAAFQQSVRELVGVAIDAKVLKGRAE